MFWQWLWQYTRTFPDSLFLLCPALSILCSNLCLTDECVSITNIWECRNLCMWQSSKWRRKTVGRVPGYSFYCSALGICLIVPNKLQQNGQADTIRYILICISMTFPMPEEGLAVMLSLEYENMPGLLSVGFPSLHVVFEKGKSKTCSK